MAPDRDPSTRDPSTREPSPREHSPALPLWELVQTHHVVARAFRALFARHGLTPTQFGVLACLADGDDFTKAELARATLVTPQSMDPLVEGLLARGLIARDEPARRGRAAGIRITGPGLDLVTRTRPEVEALNAPEHIGLRPGQISMLVDQLRVIRDALDAPS